MGSLSLKHTRWGLQLSHLFAVSIRHHVTRVAWPQGLLASLQSTPCQLLTAGVRGVPFSPWKALRLNFGDGSSMRGISEVIVLLCTFILCLNVFKDTNICIHLYYYGLRDPQEAALKILYIPHEAMLLPVCSFHGEAEKNMLFAPNDFFVLLFSLKTRDWSRLMCALVRVMQFYASQDMDEVLCCHMLWQCQD